MSYKKEDILSMPSLQFDLICSFRQITEPILYLICDAKQLSLQTTCFYSLINILL